MPSTVGQLNSLKENIKAEAYTLGFNFCGVTKLEEPPHFGEFKEWLADGKHGEMAYLATPRTLEARRQPWQLLEGCKSILCLAIHYLPPQFAAGDPGELQGRVAAYAWGDDYHSILPPMLDRLAEKISQITGHPVSKRRYTDTGPILERDLAQVAGIGWIGKNTCLISPAAGSYLLLAELLVDLHIEPDEPFIADRCGACDRCIQACPTGCILPGRTIDARRCISYLTIENKGIIPHQLRRPVGSWVFGCDICQQVCPWNRFAPPVAAGPLMPRPGLPYPGLLSEMRLSPQEFNQKFKNNPLQRAHRRGYLRNCAVAVGNTHASEAVPILRKTLLAEPEPLVRAHTAWALGQIDTAPARLALTDALSIETDELVISELHGALNT